MSSPGRNAFATLARQVGRALVRIERDQVCCGLTLQQFETLRMLLDGPVGTRRIADHFSVDLSTASRNLAVLQREGLVRRSPSARDGRATDNALTKKGARCLQSLSCDERMVYGALYASIPSGERAAVLRALTVLGRALTVEACGCGHASRS